MIDNEKEIDIDVQDDFEQEPEQKPSLKDAWDSNPLFKIVAVVLGIAVLVGGYLTVFGGKEDAENISRVGTGQAGTKIVAGQSEVDPEYRAALEAENKQRTIEALNTGVSAIPTPIGTSKSQGIDLPEAPDPAEKDPLAEWRARTEARRMIREETIPEQGTARQPDVVPLVQPVRPQAAAKINAELVGALAGQMRVIIGAQAPQSSKAARVTALPSDYVKMINAEQAARVTAGPGGVPGAAALDPLNAEAEVKSIVTAGSISYAQLLNNLNSDIPGPVLAHVLSGPFAGGRALGEFTLRDEYLVLEFNRIVKDGVSYRVRGIALDEKTTLSAHQSDVDHHYFTRVLLPAAAAFIEGYGSAVAETGTSTTTTSGGGVATEEPEPDAREQVFKGVEEASGKLSEIVDEDSDRPITVMVHKGTTMGILFMEPVTTASVEQ